MALVNILRLYKATYYATNTQLKWQDAQYWAGSTSPLPKTIVNQKYIQIKWENTRGRLKKTIVIASCLSLMWSYILKTVCLLFLENITML